MAHLAGKSVLITAAVQRSGTAIAIAKAGATFHATDITQLPVA